MLESQLKQAYVITVNMGYGHLRAVYPLANHAAKVSQSNFDQTGIIIANDYPGIPNSDQNIWERSRFAYELVSRLKQQPLIGNLIFTTFDWFQRILPFYPRRNLSQPNLELRLTYKLIQRGWGQHLINCLNQKPLPLITSFPTVAFMAEAHHYLGSIYCLCTDSDINRMWAPLNPKTSKIIYLAPNKRVRERLLLYGVKAEQIFVTGFPLPAENIGENLEILKTNLGCRISRLDPTRIYQNKFAHHLETYLGSPYCQRQAPKAVTITFAVGGAGAQRDIGVMILKSLHKKISRGEVNLNFSAGTKRDIADFYQTAITRLHLASTQRDNIKIIYSHNIAEYFQKFNQALNTTDILWTKPSELSFYAGLGLPIIIAPPIGSQENFNRDWLLSIGAGFKSDDPNYTHEWLFDWLKSGWLAEAAMNGFLNAPHHGAKHIQEVVFEGKRSEIEMVHLL